MGFGQAYRSASVSPACRMMLRWVVGLRVWVAMDWDRNQTGALLEVVVMRPLDAPRLNPFRSSALAIARPETNFTR